MRKIILLDMCQVATAANVQGHAEILNDVDGLLKGRRRHFEHATVASNTAFFSLVDTDILNKNNP